MLPILVRVWKSLLSTDLHSLQCKVSETGPTVSSNLTASSSALVLEVLSMSWNASMEPSHYSKCSLFNLGCVVIKF